MGTIYTLLNNEKAEAQVTPSTMKDKVINVLAGIWTLDIPPTHQMLPKFSVHMTQQV